MKKNIFKTVALITLLCAGLPILAAAYDVPWLEKYYQATPSVSEYNELGWLIGGDFKTPVDISVPSELFAQYSGVRSIGNA
jgi:hypothetical protein